MRNNSDPSSGDVIAELAARVTYLEARLAALEGEPTSPQSSAEGRLTDDAAAVSSPASRRQVLRLAGAAAVAGISAAMVGARVAAADGGVLLNGSPTSTSTPTRTNYTGTLASNSGFVFQ